MTVDDDAVTSAGDTSYCDIDNSLSSLTQAQSSVAMTTTPTNHLPLHSIYSTIVTWMADLCMHRLNKLQLQ